MLIVGFQAAHTLGRRLVEQRDQVRIFGVMHQRAAEVVVLNGLSAHADQADLRKVFLVHGEPSAQAPELGERVDLTGGPGIRLAP